MPALDVGGEETATVFCSTPIIRAKHMLCLTPIRRQPDGIPTLGRAAYKTGVSCGPATFYITPSDGRGFAAWLHLGVLARGCPHLVMVNAWFDRNGLKLLE